MTDPIIEAYLNVLSQEERAILASLINNFASPGPWITIENIGYMTPFGISRAFDAAALSGDLTDKGAEMVKSLEARWDGSRLEMGGVKMTN